MATAFRQVTKSMSMFREAPGEVPGRFEICNAYLGDAVPKDEPPWTLSKLSKTFSTLKLAMFNDSEILSSTIVESSTNRQFFLFKGNTPAERLHGSRELALKRHMHLNGFAWRKLCGLGPCCVSVHRLFARIENAERMREKLRGKVWVQDPKCQIVFFSSSGQLC